MKDILNNWKYEIITLTAVVVVWAFAGYRNVDEVKAAAPKVWADSGFVVVGYEGYECGLIFGGHVWYIVKRAGDDGVIYHGFISKWGNEYHIYNLKAINAIAP